MFRKRSSKNDLQTEYSCSIRFLDDSDPIQLSFKKDTIGQWLFDRVCEKLNLVEKDYFGLRFVDGDKQRHWLDPLKTVYKQLKGVSPLVLCFRVKFYPEDPMKLHEEITRYYQFLQLRRDLHHGRLLCSPTDAVLLAAYIVQSEVGDYDPLDHSPGYITDFKMLPKQNAKMEDQICEIHKTLKGQVPAEAEANFLKKASVLDTYGVDPHQVKDQRGDQLYLGVTHQGIMTFRGSRRTQLYKWNQIRRIAYEGKMFIVHVNVAEDEDVSNPKKKQQPIGYKCLTVPACKYLWRCAVEQQLFFTLSSSINAPKVRSGGTLLTRGSRFRFSGRCQAEAFSASENIKRSEPNFARSSSLPNFARKQHPYEHKASTLNTSVMSEPVKEDRRRYNVYLAPRRKGQEAAIDVPNQSFESSVGEFIPQGPVMKAPLAQEEMFVERSKQVSAAVPPKINGSVPTNTVGVLETSLDVSQPYEPNVTQIEDDEDNFPKPSLDEQIKQLEEHYEKITSEQNHIQAAPPGVKDGSTKTDLAAKTQSTPSKVPPKSKCAKCCKVLFYSFLFAAFMMLVTFIILFYTNYQHPILTEGRKQLHFMEPVKHFIDDKVNLIYKKFK